MPRNGNLRWRYGKKVVLFNLFAIVSFVVMVIIGSYFYPDANNWYYLTLILVSTISSILYWVHTGRQFRGSFRDRFMVSLIGSSIYWLITVGFVVSALLYDSFGAVVLLIFGLVMGIAAVICTLVISLVKKRRGDPNT
jgi:predicted MFS family arabinose efflux permease